MAQESVKSIEETGCSPPEGPILCEKNCGFFGTEANLNLCSECYKIHISTHAEAAMTTAGTSTSTPAAETDMSVKTVSETVTTDRSMSQRQKSEPTSAATITDTSTATGGTSPQESGSSSAATEAVSDERGKRNSLPDPMRCFSCRKRVGLTGFKCKCGNLYCSAHRYFDKHSCTYDYKSAGREAIAQANPVVKADKIERC